MPTNTTNQMQRVPDWQVAVDASGNQSTLLQMDRTVGVDGRAFIESLDVNDETLITIDDISKEDAANALTDVTLDVDGVTATGVRNGRSFDLDLDLGAVRAGEKGTPTDGGGVEVYDNSGVKTLRVRFPSQELGVDPAFIAGLVPTYLTSTQVRFTPGAVIVGNSVRSTQTPVDVTVSGFPGGGARGTVYFYADESKAGLVVYSSLSAPTQETDRSGWYWGDDRCIGSARSPQGASTLHPFHTRDLGGGRYETHLVSMGVETVIGSFPSSLWDGTWKSAFNANGHTMAASIPVMADGANLRVGSDDSQTGAPVVRFGLGTDWSGAVEGAAAPFTLYGGPASVYYHDSHDHDTFQVLVPLTVSGGRKLLFAGQSSGTNRIIDSFHVLGWTIKR